MGPSAMTMRSMTLFRSTLILLSLALGLSAPSFAKGSVFLNGVNIDGTPVEIERAKVRIDAEGNVHLTAPGYQVHRQDARAAEGFQPQPFTRVISGPQRPQARYWLATEFSLGSRVSYDVDVIVNGELTVRIREEDGQVSEEHTGRLRSGRNTLRFVARKVGRTGRNEGSQTPFLRVHIGEGTEQADRIVLQRPEITFSVRADQREDQQREFTLEAR